MTAPPQSAGRRLLRHLLLVGGPLVNIFLAFLAPEMMPFFVIFLGIYGAIMGAIASILLGICDDYKDTCRRWAALYDKAKNTLRVEAFR